MGVFDLQERHRVRLLIRRDACDRFYSCLYYVPRDLFNSALRERIQQVLAERLGADEIEFSTRFSDSILARVHFVIRVAPQAGAAIDEAAIEAAVVEASRACTTSCARRCWRPVAKRPATVSTSSSVTPSHRPTASTLAPAAP
ncbi:hypothetical protein ACFQDL_12590 [Marinobacterium aestuariivivens]|uniref:NAD-glutamate dehydrogenase ACT2 domain-containing protein n=1 Tax=Marinobacterium aestuariivivens TaxID=1698799 RepID=A0ABW2A019_9GAMM